MKKLLLIALVAMDWLSFPCRVLTPAFGSEAAITLPITDTAITRTDPTMVPFINRNIATTMGRHTTGITGIEFITTTTIIIITTTIKMI